MSATSGKAEACDSINRSKRLKTGGAQTANISSYPASKSRFNRLMGDIATDAGWNLLIRWNYGSSFCLKIQLSKSGS